MNGAESLVKSLIKAGVEVCFTNPGTSEMHVVMALDAIPGMRPVLVLFEGVATGAADGLPQPTVGRQAATTANFRAANRARAARRVMRRPLRRNGTAARPCEAGGCGRL